MKPIFMKNGEMNLMKIKSDRLNIMQLCRICGTEEDALHHPACPVGKAIDSGYDEQELFVLDENILNFITNAVAIAGQEYARFKQEETTEKIGLEKWEQYQKDYNEISDFADALVGAGFLLSADDVIYFLKNSMKYQQYYMLWLELNRPIKETDEAWSLFVTELWERKQVGKQTKDTGN